MSETAIRICEKDVSWRDGELYWQEERMLKTNLFEYEGMDHEERVRQAAKNLEGTIKKTNLVYSEFFSRECGNSVYMKPENLQVTGSFKVRGAFNKIANLSLEERERVL